MGFFLRSFQSKFSFQAFNWDPVLLVRILLHCSFAIPSHSRNQKSDFFFIEQNFDKFSCVVLSSICLVSWGILLASLPPPPHPVMNNSPDNYRWVQKETTIQVTVNCLPSVKKTDCDVKFGKTYLYIGVAGRSVLLEVLY